MATATTTWCVAGVSAWCRAEALDRAARATRRARPFQYATTGRVFEPVVVLALRGRAGAIARLRTRKRHVREIAVADLEPMQRELFVGAP